MNFAFDAFVTDILFDAGGAAFALGDGQVRWEDGAAVQAHDGAILTAAAHPTGEGVLTGGDDGRLVWSRAQGPQMIAEAPGKWIDALAVSPGASLIAFAAGREVQVRDLADAKFQRTFSHERGVAALALDAKARRLAAATYGGVALWWARIAEQKPVMMRWAGSHVAAAFSPDGKFLVSSMQENALHGWRLADGRDMRMGGYPSKVKSLVFLSGGEWLATSGAPGAVLWPFAGASGPMGKQASEIGFEDGAIVVRCAGNGDLLAAGLDDGRVWACNLAAQDLRQIRTKTGPPITALAVRGDRIAWGDEAGGAGVAEFASA